MDWKHRPAYLIGSGDQDLLRRNAYLVTENRLLRHQITGRARLTDTERQTLATLGKYLGQHVLKEVTSLVTPDTMLAWHRKLVAHTFDGSGQRKSVGRPKVAQKLEALVVRLA
jgi:putative transposase